ncbi:hypothetical protein R69746_07757 [Paraburkholderia aspalathi]|uniref:hypothetical protein n=1 Tax=Paraburkholderia aspalathi TaxID=1324617 RepID=UPI00190AA11B|nr:hypothetical protein [Paraburkholderia aspalathi]MBK3843750.1 hypothetical protein [Paraburkholderia aspalathi]CAE6859828.1 hypothetical protein R69746_07757 [Paraburkholderia aspalathi]
MGLAYTMSESFGSLQPGSLTMKKTALAALLLINSGLASAEPGCNLDQLKTNSTTCDRNQVSVQDKTSYVDFRVKEVARLRPDDVQSFLDSLKNAVESNDKVYLSNVARYPLRYFEHKKRRSVRDPAQFLKKYKNIFTNKVKHAIESQQYQNLSVDSEGEHEHVSRWEFGAF